MTISLPDASFEAVPFEDTDEDLAVGPVRAKRDFLERVFQSHHSNHLGPSPSHKLVEERHQWIESGYGGKIKVTKDPVVVSDGVKEAHKKWKEQDEKIAAQKRAQEQPVILAEPEGCDHEEVAEALLTLYDHLAEDSVLDESYDALFDAVNGDDSPNKFLSASLLVDPKPVVGYALPASLQAPKSPPNLNNGRLLDDSYCLDTADADAVDDEIYAASMELVNRTRVTVLEETPPTEPPKPTESPKPVAPPQPEPPTVEASCMESCTIL